MRVRSNSCPQPVLHRAPPETRIGQVVTQREITLLKIQVTPTRDEAMQRQITQTAFQRAMKRLMGIEKKDNQ